MSRIEDSAMKRVAIPEAQTELASLIEEVEKGGEVVITRDGKPVARLLSAIPSVGDMPGAEPVAQRRQALARLQETARELKINPSHQEIKSWISEGRR
jgi:prevent-host-death family protein